MKQTANHRESLQWQIWADWKIAGGWHYVPKGEDLGWSARSTTYTHSDPVMMQLLLTERHNGEAERIDIIFADLPGLEHNFIALFYYLKIGTMNHTASMVMTERRGADWAHCEQGSAQYYERCKEKAKSLHNSACRHLRKSMMFYRELDASKRVAARMERERHLTRRAPSGIIRSGSIIASGRTA